MHNIVIKTKSGTKHRIDNVTNLTIIGSALVIWDEKKEYHHFDMVIVEEVVVW